MRLSTLSLCWCIGLLTAVHAYTVPSNLASFYSKLAAQEQCNNTLKSGFGNGDTDYPNDWSYCETDNMLYIHHNGGGLASMAIDVDGKRPKGDNPQDSQDGTAFEGILKRYNISGVTDLDPYIHPYVVFGNQGTKKGYTTFHPRMYDIQPLSVMAVVCADKLIFGIWGDTNGDDDWPSIDSVGEASQAVGSACFGNAVNASYGHARDDVLFLAFKGAEAVPGPRGARWAATSYEEFETSIAGPGNRLLAQAGLAGSGNGTATPTAPPAETPTGGGGSSSAAPTAPPTRTPSGGASATPAASPAQTRTGGASCNGYSAAAMFALLAALLCIV